MRRLGQLKFVWLLAALLGLQGLTSLSCPKAEAALTDIRADCHHDGQNTGSHHRHSPECGQCCGLAVLAAPLAAGKVRDVAIVKFATPPLKASPSGLIERLDRPPRSL